MLSFINYVFYTTANNRDFKVGEYRLHFTVNSNIATVKIPIHNDHIVENTEAFAVSLYIPDYYRHRYVNYGDPFFTKVIIDDGQLTVGIYALLPTLHSV